MTISNENLPFNRPAQTGKEEALLQQVLARQELTEGRHAELCRSWLAEALGSEHVFLTPSCTHALEMASLLLDIAPGDEIIMPSFTFVSSANAFVLRGGVPVFVDIRPDTMNIDETLIEAAITPRTKAILVMHYGSVACDMDAITAIAKKHNLKLVEDAAHALTAKWKGKPLGSFGDIAAFSFHQTKNFTSGEGGAIVIKDAKLAERAGVLRHKGTNREAFMKKNTPHYSWVDMGSSWTMPELSAAYLYGNLSSAEAILKRRHALWQFYTKALQPLVAAGHVTLPVIPEDCSHNAHLFYIKVKDIAERTRLLGEVNGQNITMVFHYVPLHSSPAGQRFGRFHGQDRHTTKESERLIRLPLFYNMTDAQAERVASALSRYYGS